MFDALHDAVSLPCKKKLGPVEKLTNCLILLLQGHEDMFRVVTVG